MTDDERIEHLRRLASSSNEGSLSAHAREQVLHGPRTQASESAQCALDWLRAGNEEMAEAALESLVWYMHGGEEDFIEELSAAEHVDLACDFWANGPRD